MAEQTLATEKSSNEILECAVNLAERINSSEGKSAAIETIVGYFIKNGEVDRAAVLADAVTEPIVRNRLLATVIGKCVKQDDDEYAYQLLEALDQDGAVDFAKENIAWEKASKGDYEAAYKIAEELEQRPEFVAGIVERQAFNGDELGALETLERLDYYDGRANVLTEIALDHLKNDRSERAIEILEKARKALAEIDFQDNKLHSGLNVAYAYLEAKREDEACVVFSWVREIAEGIDNVTKDSWLASVAGGFLAAGDVDLADETLDLVVDKAEVADCLINFAEVYYEEKENDEAMEALEEAYAILNSQTEREIRDSKARFKHYSNIARMFATLEKNERAIEIAQEIPSASHKYFALTRIAQICTLKSIDEMAGLALKAIDDEAQKMTAMVAVSDAKASIDQTESAVEVLKEASSMTDSVTQFIVRADIYNEFIPRFHKLGIKEKSREIASENLKLIEEIKGNENKSAALASLSQIYRDLDFDLSEADSEVLKSLARN